MAEAAVKLGRISQVLINDVIFHHVTADIDIIRQEHDTNDSSTAAWDDAQGGRRRMVVNSLTAFRRVGTETPHAAPLNLMVDEYCDLKVYEEAGSEPYHSATFLLTRFNKSQDAGTDAPQRVTIAGRSHNVVLLPDQT